MKPISKAVIPVAGLGTRGLPFTKVVPKELLPVIDTPTIHFIVEEVLKAGINQVIFVTSQGKSAIEDYFDSAPGLEHWLERRGKTALAQRMKEIGKLCEVTAVRQKEPLGLGHAVLCARPVVGDEPFVVCLGDEIFPAWDAKVKPPLERLVQDARGGDSVVGVVEIPRNDSQSYGMVDLGGARLGAETVLVRRTVEKPKPEEAPSDFAIVGRYAFTPEIFDALARLKPGVGGEYQLTDAMSELASKGRLRARLLEGPRYDIGNHLFYVKAQIDAALRRPELAERLRQYIRTLC